MAPRGQGPPAIPADGAALMFFVVSYDIPDDERRLKVSKALENFGKRVRKSVFECELADDDLERLQRTLEALIDPEEDNLRYDRLCHDCLEQTRIIGRVPLTQDPDYFIV